MKKKTTKRLSPLILFVCIILAAATLLSACDGNGSGNETSVPSGTNSETPDASGTSSPDSTAAGNDDTTGTPDSSAGDDSTDSADTTGSDETAGNDETAGTPDSSAAESVTAGSDETSAVPATSSEDTTPVTPVVTDPTEPVKFTVDGKETAWEAGKKEMTVSIPDGHPRIPRIGAVASDKNAKVSVIQATMAPDASEAKAKITVTVGTKTGEYYVKMVKDKNQGITLQYDDRYTFVPSVKAGKGQTYTFASSDSSILSVTDAGVITARAISSSPVIVTASLGGKVVGTLTVNRVDKAQICLFLITGQSNAAGSYDDSSVSNKDQSDKPAAGISYCIDVDKGSCGALYDLSRGRTGFAPSLGKRWYALTGEKTLMIQTAVSGSSIESWLKGGDSYGSRGNCYDNTLKAYNTIFAKYSKHTNYEIIRTGAFWCQGETGQVREWKNGGWSTNNPKIQTSSDYYSKFMQMYGDFKADMKIEFFSIMLVRALKQTVSAESTALALLTDLVPVRAAQYTINNTTDDTIFISSRLCDIARKAESGSKYSKEVGYGYMGSENVHYTQEGYNAQGIELANNTFARLSAVSDRSPKELEIIDSDGRTRISDGAVVKVEQNKGRQLAAIVLPLYTNAPQITFKITSGSDKCSVDKFGKVSFASTAAVGTRATLTVTSQSGLKKVITLELAKEQGSVTPVDEPTGQELVLQWDFNDLTEMNSYSDLSLSSRSGSGNYSFKDGNIVLPTRETDFTLAKPFRLAQNFDWSIEWRGMTGQSSALFGAEYSKNNFIYVAYKTASWDNPFRMVSSTGTTAMIPYGNYASKNAEMNTWKIDYKASTRTMTLYFLGDGKSSEVVGTYKWNDDFTFNITNIFGRYGSASTVVCWNGEMDYVKVVARTAD